MAKEKPEAAPLRGRPVLIVFVSVATVIGIVVLANIVFSQLALRSVDATHSAMITADFNCPGGTASIERWGKAGWMRHCIDADSGNRQGPWEAWEEGRLQIRGEYAAGKRTGSWTYFGAGETVEKVVSYDDEASPDD